MEIPCSGILPEDNITWPCTNKVKVNTLGYPETGLRLIWQSNEGQGHNFYFCSWNCLKGFIENSQWLKDEVKKWKEEFYTKSKEAAAEIHGGSPDDYIVK
jgi:hypothetical protein